MAKQTRNLLDDSGQSVVEYILLLAVITSLAFTVYSNPKFKQFFGERGFFEAMRGRIGFAYRYGYEGNDPAEEFQYTNNKHKTYLNEESNSSRFFSPIDEYGK